MTRRSGRPRTDRWRARWVRYAATSTTSRLRHLAANSPDPMIRDVCAAELERREEQP